VEDPNKRNFVVQIFSYFFLSETNFPGIFKTLLTRENVLYFYIFEFLYFLLIRNIPEGTGWIMDGFPSTAQQAKVYFNELTQFCGVFTVKLVII